MALFRTLRSFWRRASGKDVVIIVLVLLLSYCVTFSYQSEYMVRKLIAQNEQLQQDNERSAHMIELMTESLQRELKKTSEACAVLRDPFRPDHPTREESEDQKGL